MPIIGGGVAFFGFLAIFPALIALISIYGLVASPETVAKQVENLSDAAARQRRATSSATQLNDDRRQQRQRAHRRPGRLDPRRALERVRRRRQPDHRGQHRLRRGGDPQLRQAQADVAGADPRRDRLRAGHLRPGRRRPRRARARCRWASSARSWPRSLRWVLLLAVFAGALAVLYRVAPDRDAPRFRWVSLGAVIVTVDLGDRQRRVQPLRQQLRVLRQDLRRDRRRHRADAVAVPDLLPGAARARRSTPRPSTRPRRTPPRASRSRWARRDAEMADTLPEPPEPTKGDSDPTRKPAPELERRSAHVRRHERRLDDLDRLGPAADVDGQLRRPSSTPAAVSSSARAMPVRRVGENVPLVTSPIARAVGVEHRHARARDAPAGRAQAPQQPRRARPPSRRAAPRGPRTPASSSPPPSPLRAWFGRDLAATARARAADSPSRCAGCRGRPRPHGRMPRSCPASRTTSHSSPARSASTSSS